jgi:hypothetical protein
MYTGSELVHNPILIVEMSTMSRGKHGLRNDYHATVA